MHRTPDRRRPTSRTKQKRRANSRSSNDTGRVFQHGTYGAIPLIPETWTDANGRTHVSYAYDLSYLPPLPKGAVRGDVRRQEFCPMCHVPRYFYVDSERRCVQCGRSFVFKATEQKYWYETLKFHFDSEATRCPTCRSKRRSDRALQRQLADASKEAKALPDDPSKQVALGEAIVRWFERCGEGSLPRAIAACRKARRLCGNHPRSEVGEAMFWEAKAHALAGRTTGARELFRKFVEAGMTGKRGAHLLEEAKGWLANR